MAVNPILMSYFNATTHTEWGVDYRNALCQSDSPFVRQ